MLKSALLLNAEYTGQVRSVAYYIGNGIASELKLGSERPNARTCKKVEDAFKLLNLCQLNINSIRPLEAEMRFDVLKSKREFIDISIAFLSGILKGLLNDGANIQTNVENRDYSYTVRISERR
jgi:hypothetical protein